MELSETFGVAGTTSSLKVDPAKMHSGGSVTYRSKRVFLIFRVIDNTTGIAYDGTHLIGFVRDDTMIYDLDIKKRVMSWIKNIEVRMADRAFINLVVEIPIDQSYLDTHWVTGFQNIDICSETGVPLYMVLNHELRIGNIEVAISTIPV